MTNRIISDFALSQQIKRERLKEKRALPDEVLIALAELDDEYVDRCYDGHDRGLNRYYIESLNGIESEEEYKETLDRITLID